MPIVVGIDGTGGGTWITAARNARYDKDFAKSHVRTICRGAGARRYFRGPGTLGAGMPEAINGGVSYIKAQVKSNSQPVLLTGYSRGGLGVIVIAKELKKAGIDVQAMILFDAVDRHVAYDGAVIPKNVANVLHLRRSSRSSSRESFGNDGTSYYSSSTKYEQAFFLCTHGAMGGTHWKDDSKSGGTLIDEGGYDGMTTITYDQDERMSGVVWTYARMFMGKHGF